MDSVFKSKCSFSVWILCYLFITSDAKSQLYDVEWIHRDSTDSKFSMIAYWKKGEIKQFVGRKLVAEFVFVQRKSPVSFLPKSTLLIQQNTK